MRLRPLIACLSIMIGTVLTGCGSGGEGNTPASSPVPPAYTIAATVTGLLSGQSVTLLNNGSDALIISANNQLTAFNTPIAQNGSYTVTVETQPTGQVCSVTNGSGNGVTANVTNVSVACSTLSYTIGGNITGLVSNQRVTILNNGSDSMIVTGGGTGSDPFMFASPVAYLGGYSVTVSSQPDNETCSISGGTGSGYGVNANVSSVALTCSTNSYQIGGSVTGLASGQQVTLFNNGGDAATVTGSGSGTDPFAFSSPVAYLGSYLVTINQQPNNEVCTVATNPSGNNNVSANVSNVGVTCSLNSYSIGGTVSQLLNSETVTVVNNGANPTTITGHVSGTNAFTFSIPVAYLGSYFVTISTQPSTEICSLVSNSGTATGNVSNVNLTCDDPNFVCQNSGTREFRPAGFQCACSLCYNGDHCENYDPSCA